MLCLLLDRHFSNVLFRVQLSCVLKTTKCAKKRAENFYPVTMTLGQDHLSDITTRLEELKISEDPSEELKDVHQISVGKKSRTENSLPGSVIAGRSTFFDPLLYLRVKSTASCGTIPTSAENGTSEPPSLDQLLRFGQDNAGLLVEPIVRPRKQKTPPESVVHKPVPLESKPVPKLPVAVYRFCQQHNVRYFALGVRKTFRSIAFRRRPKDQGCNNSDPWEDYIDENRVGHYRLCHAVMLQEEGNCDNKIVVILPHSVGKQREINLASLQSILNLSVPLKRMSLTALEKELGFPTFVCPPFGHEFAPKIHSDSMSKKFSTVIDARIVDEGTTDCFFDLGIVGIIVRPAELARLGRTFGWTVVPETDLLVARN